MEIQEFISKAPSDFKGAINSHCVYLMEVFYNGNFNRIWEQFQLDSTADLPKNIDAWTYNDWSTALDIVDELAQSEFEKKNNL